MGVAATIRPRRGVDARYRTMLYLLPQAGRSESFAI